MRGVTVNTYRMTIEYDGTPWHGWQVQAGRPTVQQALEEALETVLRTRVPVTGSGRTDAGVHARGQVVHFNASKSIDPKRLVVSMNGVLPPSIRVLAADAVDESFHARYDARRRRYHYHVSTAPRVLDRSWRVPLRPAPDFDCMNVAARRLLGEHDFDAFCRTASETENRVCTIFRAEWVPEERPGDWRFVIEADRFLHGMVRAVVGTLLQIGRGRRPPDDLDRILASRDRRQAGPAAAPEGLVLEAVTYGPPE